MATGGLLLLALLRTVTTWLRTRRMSALSITITAGTVLPFAVWYGRGENKIDPIAEVYFITADDFLFVAFNSLTLQPCYSLKATAVLGNSFDCGFACKLRLEVDFGG